MKLRVDVSRRAADETEIDAALHRIGRSPGLYFGCDAGAPGLHPPLAYLGLDALVRFRVFDDRIEIEPQCPDGERLLLLPGLAPLIDVGGGRRLARLQSPHGEPAGGERADTRSGPAHVGWLRAFLRCLPASEAVVMLGMFAFDAHRLNAPGARPGPQPGATAGTALAVLQLCARLWRRGPDGQWQAFEVAVRGDPEPAGAVSGGEQSPDVMHSAPPDAGTTAPAPAPATATGSVTGTDDFAAGQYAQLVQRAVVALRERPIVSLTLSQSFRRRASADAAAAFQRLRRVNPAPATFFANLGDGSLVFGASPDLQLRVAEGFVESWPVCGTVARGPGAVGEAESFRHLINESVDEASLAVCTDALRNDLAPLCEPGSLQLMDRRRQLSLATVVHTVDRLRGRLRAGADLWDALLATAAPAMVTGTPRQEALAAIAEFEASPRRWYGGMVVAVDAAGEGLVGTVLRAAELRGGMVEVRAGGDLLTDSDPDREEQESRLKAVSLWRALGLAESAGPPAVELRAVDSSAPDRPAVDLPAVDLHDCGDAFGDGLIDVLVAAGVPRISPAQGSRPASTAAYPPAPDPQPAPAAVAVVAGDDVRRIDAALRRLSGGGLLALGDAAARVLLEAGFPSDPRPPLQARLLRCISLAAAPWAPCPPFLVTRYGRQALVGPAPPGSEWTIWAEAEDGLPLAAWHPTRHIVCLLFRPDSLLSAAPARTALRLALSHLGRSTGG